MLTVFSIGSKNITLKYARKMSRGEVERMKSFVTNYGEKLIKTPKFNIIKQDDQGHKRIFKISKSSF